MSATDDFANLTRVVGDDLRFRLRLGIGEDAYRTLRYGNAAQKLWDVGGMAATGAAAAKLPVIATTFFAPSGFSALLASVGFGLGAVTPIGWVIAAGAATAGAYYGVLRLVGNYGDKRVSKVPTFINTPIDLLGATLVDMMGTLAVKLGEVDGKFSPDERKTIVDYFVSDWGIDAAYARKAIKLIAANAAKISLSDAAKVLGQFLRENPDCNAQVIRDDILAMLSDIARADGRLDEREAMALEKVDALLRSETDPSVGRTTGAIARGIGRGASALTSGVAGAGAAVTDRIGAGLETLGRKLRRSDKDRDGGN